MQLPAKRRLVRALSLRLVGPLVGLGVRLRLLRGGVVLETVGRKTGAPRRVQVGARVEGRKVWVVAAHGRDSAYVRNIEANPLVRVLIRGRWHAGTAAVVDEDDAGARIRVSGNRVNALALRVIGTSLLTVRIELDP